MLDNGAGGASAEAGKLKLCGYLPCKWTSASLKFLERPATTPLPMAHTTPE
jgi:hypothetical protein